MSELSQSLIDAAAVALVSVTPDNEHADRGAKVAVAAVLETLDDEVMRRVLANEEPVDLRRLAVEAKEAETDGQ